MKIRILGAHNCESADSRMVSILFDDIMAIDAGSLTSSLSFEDQQKLKAILLTHGHYDHVRDIPAIALNLFSMGKTITVYSTKTTADAVSGSFFNGKIYPDFTRLPETKPAVQFSIIEPYRQDDIYGFSVIATPINHGGAAVGYQVMSPEGSKVFYAVDTGSGLNECWHYVAPELLIIETTFPNRLKEFALNSRHLTPSMLDDELMCFKHVKGYLPSVVVLHMDPKMEQEIESEIKEVSRNHNIPISLAYEGMEIMLKASTECFAASATVR